MSFEEKSTCVHLFTGERRTIKIVISIPLNDICLKKKDFCFIIRYCFGQKQKHKYSLLFQSDFFVGWFSFKSDKCQINEHILRIENTLFHINLIGLIQRIDNILKCT